MEGPPSAYDSSENSRLNVSAGSAMVRSRSRRRRESSGLALLNTPASTTKAGTRKAHAATLKACSASCRLMMLPIVCSTTMSVAATKRVLSNQGSRALARAGGGPGAGAPGTGAGAGPAAGSSAVGAGAARPGAALFIVAVSCGPGWRRGAATGRGHLADGRGAPGEEWRGYG